MERAVLPPPGRDSSSWRVSTDLCGSLGRPGPKHVGTEDRGHVPTVIHTSNQRQPELHVTKVWLGGQSWSVECLMFWIMCRTVYVGGGVWWSTTVVPTNRAATLRFLPWQVRSMLTCPSPCPSWWTWRRSFPQSPAGTSPHMGSWSGPGPRLLWNHTNTLAISTRWSRSRTRTNIWRKVTHFNSFWTSTSYGSFFKLWTSVRR